MAEYNYTDSYINNSSVRFLGEMGPNLIKIIKKLLQNQELLRYLYYTDKDPLKKAVYDEHDELIDGHPDVTDKMAYGHGDDSVVRIIPVVGTMDDSRSIITLRVLRGIPSNDNNEFLDIYFSIEIFVPNEEWIIKGDNLRPYAIMGEVQRSLEGKRINGLGEIRGSGFAVNFFTEEISAFIMNYRITQYN